MELTAHTGRRKQHLTLISETEFKQAAHDVIKGVPKQEDLKAWYFALAIGEMEARLYGGKHGRIKD